MLQKLLVKNYAIIEHSEVQFSERLSIITGETGAGKSILLGALSLILGNRADTHVLMDNKKKCVIEGTFAIQALKLQAFFDATDLDYEDTTIIRREITPSGKSRAFVNDTPIRLTELRKLGALLIDLHSQHQTLHLQNSDYQLFIIDTLANHQKKLNSYQTLFKTYQRNQRKLKALEEQDAQLKRDLDYILFQLNELLEANLEDANEQEALEKELAQLNNAEAIQQALQESSYMIEEQELSVMEQLNTIQSSLANIQSFSKDFEQLAERIDSLCIELRDINGELTALENTVVMDPERAEEINERLNLFYRLQNKHQVQNLEELIAIRNQLQSQNQSADQLEAEMKQLQQLLGQQKQQLIAKAQQISDKRKKQIPIFEKKVHQMLTRVGMKTAKIQVDQRLLPTDKLTLNGMDEITLLFAANKGSRPTELRKVASGGELSRLMLCIKSLIAHNTALPTLVFDEIDTGISGEVALKVGQVMEELAAAHQVICITHLPQIASKGETHFFIYKDHSQAHTVSKVRSLNGKDRIVAIAQMLSGDKPGEMALANAKELLDIGKVVSS